jgi:O-antigen/teichoic acid export membrane protein
MNKILSGNFRKVFNLLFWNIILLPVGLLTSVLVAKNLGDLNYGNYMYIINLYSVIYIILYFGFFHSGSRLILLSNNSQEKRDIYGLMLVFILCIYVLFLVILLLFVEFDSNITSKKILNLVYLSAPLSWTVACSTFFETIMPSDNKTGLLNKSRYWPKIIFLIIVFIYFYFYKIFFSATSKIEIITFASLFSSAIVLIVLIFFLKPTFNNIYSNFKKLWGINKKFGLNIYLGTIFSTFSMQLSLLALSYFNYDNKQLGYYSIALSFASILSFIPNTFAIVYYTDFQKSAKLPKAINYYTLIVSIVCLILMWVVVPIFIKNYYGVNFKRSIILFYLLSLGVILYGFGDYITKFLLSKGESKSLRNSSIYIGLTIIFFNSILIPKYNDVGAAITYILAGAIYFLTIYFTYRKIVI